MTSRAALVLIRQCLATDRVIVTRHFAERLSQRGLFWSDVMTVFEAPKSVRSDGRDDFNRERWFITGDAPDGLTAEVLCAVDRSDPHTVLVTIYWE